MNKHPKLQFRKFDYGRMGYEFVYMDYSDNNRMVAEPVTLKELPSHLIITEPTFALSEEDVFHLMDSLWIAGVRPSKRIVEPQNIDHMNGEISWLRGVADHLMKRKETK